MKHKGTPTPLPQSDSRQDFNHSNERAASSNPLSHQPPQRSRKDAEGSDMISKTVVRRALVTSTLDLCLKTDSEVGKVDADFPPCP